jgi:hypothetical protein
MLEARTPSEKATEEVVRRYIGRIVLRYLPFALALAIFLAMVITVPTRSPSGTSTGLASGGATYGAGGGTSTSAAPSAGAGPSTANASGSVGSGSSGGSGGVGSGGVVAGSGVNAGPVATAANIGAVGPTVSGVACGPGVRQVPWTAYSTLCVPAFHGNNGGATSRGVSGSTITVSYRISDSGEAAAIAAAEPSLNQAAQDQYFRDFVTYVNYFNTQFELYGRHVAVKEFTGQGDWVQEYQSQDPQGAEADAATAHNLGAFADVSTTAVSTTPMYAQYLASDHVISAGGVAGSDHFFQSNAPYVYADGASVSRLAEWIPNVVCQRMKGLPAIFSGDVASTHLTRKFGLIFPTNPDYQLVGRQTKTALAACGVPMADTYEYAIDITTMASDSGNVMAQMRADGVTTVICLCDTVVPRFLTLAASTQGYSPEWVDLGAPDSLAQGYNQSEWSHEIGPIGMTLPPAQSEALKVYRLASKGKQPGSIYYAIAYADAVMFFDALQNAGPDLTPATFQQGFFNLPPSLPGAQLGPWAFGQDHWTVSAGAPIGYWSPSAISGQNGVAGATLNCSGADGENHPWEPRSVYGTTGTQLHCFGK